MQPKSCYYLFRFIWKFTSLQWFTSTNIFWRKRFPPILCKYPVSGLCEKKMFQPKQEKKIKIYKHFIELIKSNFSFVLLRIRTFCSLQYLWEGQYYSCKISSSKVFHLAMSTFHGKSIETLRAIPEQKRRDRKGIFWEVELWTETESNSWKAWPSPDWEIGNCLEE